MSRAWIWFLLSCKRYGKKISFLLILLALPLAVSGIRVSEERGRTEVRIAVAANGEVTTDEILPLEQELVEKLVSGDLSQDDALFRFYACRDEQQVKDEVASKRAECGYVIEQGLREKLEKKDYKRSIRVYSAPSTVAAGLSTEVVFSALMELYDRELFVNYVEHGPVFDEIAPEGDLKREIAAAEAGALYETWLHNGSTFRFSAETYEPEVSHGNHTGRNGDGTAADDPEAHKEKNMDTVFPVRGIVAVYVFIIGLYAAAMNLEDDRKGLFLALPYDSRAVCRVSSMAAPVFLAAVSGAAALFSGGAMTGIGRELTAMLLYAAAVTAFSWLLGLLVKKPEAICCLIPFFLIGSLLFCPVMIDAGRYLPGVGSIRKLFLPWYYLKYFG